MKKILLTGTDLNASVLALGTAQFGSGLSMAQAIEQMDAYVAFGGNLIDTAHAYGNWIPGLDSPSEEVVGEWLKKSGKRNKVMISTKGGHPDMDSMSTMRVNVPALEQDLDASLKKLHVDYVDLYFLHRDDPSVPVEVILEWLESKVKAGKIRYYGCSNWSLKRLKEAQDKAKELGFQGFSCNQEMGCLADVHPETLPPSNVVMDKALRAYHEETKLGFMAYMSLARGYFMLRLANLAISDESKANYTAPSNDRIVEKLRELCNAEFSVLDYCYQYVIQQKFPSIPIAGFDNIKQIEEAVKAVNQNLPPQLLSQVSGLKELQ